MHRPIASEMHLAGIMCWYFNDVGT